MKWRSLRAFLAADFPASTKPAAREPQFTRAIRKTHLRCFPLLRSSFFAHETALPSYLPGSRFSCKHEICCEGATVHSRHSRKTHLRCFPLLRSSFLLMKWRSLRAFLAADFPASTKTCCEGATVHSRQSQNASSMLPRCFAAHFAHEMALPLPSWQQMKSTKPAAREPSSLAPFANASSMLLAASQLIFAHEMAPSWQQIFLQARNLLPGRHE